MYTGGEIGGASLRTRSLSSGADHPQWVSPKIETIIWSAPKVHAATAIGGKAKSEVGQGLSQPGPAIPGILVAALHHLLLPCPWMVLDAINPTPFNLIANIKIQRARSRHDPRKHLSISCFWSELALTAGIRLMCLLHPFHVPSLRNSYFGVLSLGYDGVGRESG